ncbi:MarR family winged helix-turn-helix transcriptional regulator [Paenibacillus sp. 1P07SE]|uniref:MarR family winged helix-turn-helix transcriptional regulator n=1 Tax=Paenibacillus sp. 1P07SE TaxID=3132209 RepID=UPI0039A4EC96
MYACSREITRIYQPLLKALDLTYTQYLTMLVLWERDGLSVKELGARLYLDSGTLTPLLKKLETAGLLTRERDRADERSVLIRLTDKGTLLREQGACVPQQVFKQSSLAPEKLIQLYQLSRELLEDLDRQDG